MPADILTRDELIGLPVDIKKDVDGDYYVANLAYFLGGADGHPRFLRVGESNKYYKLVYYEHEAFAMNDVVDLLEQMGLYLDGRFIIDLRELGRLRMDASDAAQALEAVRND